MAVTGLIPIGSPAPLQQLHSVDLRAPKFSSVNPVRSTVVVVEPTSLSVSLARAVICAGAVFATSTASFAGTVPPRYVRYELPAQAGQGGLVDTDDTAQAPTLGMRVRAIQQDLELNRTQLAQLLGITRPTAYAWCEDEDHVEPRYHEGKLQLERAEAICAALARANVGRPTSLLFTPDASGTSIFTRACEGEDVSQPLKAAIERMRQDARLTVRRMPARPLNEDNWL